MGVVQRERVPQERLGGHPGQGAHLQGAAPPPVRDGVHEPPHEGADQVGRQRVHGRLAAAHGDVGEQGQRQRVAVAHLDQALVRGRVDAARAQVGAALRGPEVPQRHDPQQVRATPGRRATPRPAAPGPR